MTEWEPIAIKSSTYLEVNQADIREIAWNRN